MPKADRVHSTPPTNTSATNPSRRGFLAQAAVVAAGGAAVGAVLPLPVSAGDSQRVLDPIYAAIEAHKAAYAVAMAAVDRHSAFENGLARHDRLRDADRLEHERATADESEAAMSRAWDGVDAAACALLGVEVTTLAGVMALLTYARDQDIDGMGWPDDLVGPDVKGAHSWQYFLIANLIDDLPEIMRGVA